MKQLLLLIFLIFALATVNAQTDSWQILFNKKVVLNGNSNKPDTELVVKTPPLKSSDKVTVQYSSAGDDNSLNRTFYINDSTDNNLITCGLNKQNGSINVSAEKLMRLMQSKQPVFIYTMAIPKDKALAARVRVRRILLCKIEWK